ncbi:CDC27 [Auxenochlorella protothecoides x Auxenochlorella symbiontica]
MQTGLRHFDGVGADPAPSTPSDTIEHQLAACVREYLGNYLYDTATFLCERLVAETPSTAHTLLLARCYYLSNQPYRTYHLLKDSSDPASRYLFATACLSLNRLTEAEDAMLPGPAAHGGVAHGAAGHFLLAKVHTLMNRHDSAASHHRAALSLDPMLWGAFEGLCTLGAETEAQAYLEGSGWAAQHGHAPGGGRAEACTSEQTPGASPSQEADVGPTPGSSQVPPPPTDSIADQAFSFPSPAPMADGGALPGVTPGSGGGPGYSGMQSYVTPSPTGLLAAPPPARKAPPAGRGAWQPRGAPPASASSGPAPAPRREAKLRRLFSDEEEGAGVLPPAPVPACRPAAEPAAPSPGPAGAAAALGLLRALGRALLHASMHRCGAALAALRALPPAHRETGWALCTTGRALAGAVRYAESARAFARARALEPGRLADMEAYSTVLWHLRAGPALSALAQDLLALDRLSPAAWCAAGNCFSLQRDHDTALRFFRRALQLDGGRAYAHTLAGHEFLALEDFDKAMGCYRAALRIEPRHYNAWFGMGHIFYRQEKWSLAEYHFRRATAIHPTSSVLRCYLGMALRRLERLEEALLELHRAIAADPKNPLARFEAANVLLACERPRDALHELQALHDVAPQEVSTYFQMGKVHKRLGEVDQAMRCFCAALDLQPPAADSELIKGAIERLRVTEDALDEEM